MRALRFHADHDIRVEDIPEPELRPGAVKIKVAYCGICGTDLHEYLDGPIFCPGHDTPHPLSGETLPVTLGHEMSGVVEAVGEGVDAVKPGDSVVVEPYFVCGECPQCKRGDYHLCSKMGFIGLAGGGGGLSEVIVVDQRWVHPVGDIPLDEAALIEPLTVAYHAVQRSEVKAGQTAIVAGAGPIGLLTAAVLKGLGVKVIVSEPTEARKQMAQQTGVADLVVDPSSEDVGEQVREFGGGPDSEGPDVGFDAAGVNATVNTLLNVVRPGGVVVMEAIWGHKAELDMHALVVREIDLRGTIAYVSNHEDTIRMVQDGAIDLKPFITAVIGLDEVIGSGFDTLINRPETAVKILVDPAR